MSRFLCALAAGCLAASSPSAQPAASFEALDRDRDGRIGPAEFAPTPR